MSPEIISKIELALELIGALAVAATIIAKLTPTPKDDGAVKKISDIVFKIIKYLPTFGVNPKTKQLEEALKEQQK